MEALSSSVARVTTRDITKPIRNVRMSELVGMGDDFDDVATVEYTAHEVEAMAALSRFRAMGERMLTRKAWKAMSVRLSDARLQLAVGLDNEDEQPLIAQLREAEKDASWRCCGHVSPFLQCCEQPVRRCDDVMRCGRVLIPVISDAEVAS